MPPLTPHNCPFCNGYALCRRVYVGKKQYVRVPCQDGFTTKLEASAPGIKYKIECAQCRAKLERAWVLEKDESLEAAARVFRKIVLRAWNNRIRRIPSNPYLLPCPCCGGEDIRPVNRPWRAGPVARYEIVPELFCIVCGLTSVALDDIDPPDAWNRRADAFGWLPVADE